MIAASSWLTDAMSTNLAVSANRSAIRAQASGRDTRVPTTVKNGWCPYESRHVFVASPDSLEPMAHRDAGSAQPRTTTVSRWMTRATVRSAIVVPSRKRVARTLVSLLAVGFLAACSTSKDAPPSNAASGSSRTTAATGSPKLATEGVVSPTTAPVEPGVVVVPDEAEAIEASKPTTTEVRVRVRLAHPAGNEALVIAEVYAGALRSAGFDVQMRAGFATPEAVFEAIRQGDADVAILGTATASTAATSAGVKSVRRRAGVAAGDPAAAAAILRDRLKAAGVSVLVPSTASVGPVLTMRSQDARGEADGIETIDDLLDVAGQMRLGAPETCDEYVVCASSLRQNYGLRFENVVTVPDIGPEARAALEAGDVDAVFLAGSDATFADTKRSGWIVLQDSRYAIAADNLVPLVSTKAITIPLRIALDTVSAVLTTADLQSLNRATTINNVKPFTAARDWLRKQQLS